MPRPSSISSSKGVPAVVRRERANRRRGRRVLLWTGVLFLLTQFLAGLVLDHWVLPIRFPSAGRLFAQLQTWPRPPEIVCLGSSRFLGDIVPELVNPLLQRSFPGGPRIFNAAVTGGDAVVADWILERMLRRGYRPELVVMEVCPENLAQRCVWLEEHTLRQMSWADLATYFPDILVQNRHPLRLVSARLLPVYRYRRQVCRFAGDALLTWLTGRPHQSVLPSDVVRNQAPPELLTGPVEAGGPAPPRALEHVPVEQRFPKDDMSQLDRWLRDYQVSGAMPQALERLLRRCRDHHIGVILIGAPVTEVHRKTYTPQVDAAYRGYLRGLERAYGCRFFDYRDRVPDDYFFDHHHVGLQGGAFFSRLLAREVLVPAWRQRQAAGGLSTPALTAQARDRGPFIGGFCLGGTTSARVHGEPDRPNRPTRP
jgi:hypothetical protein